VLDTLCDNFPTGTAAPIEWHVGSAYPLYSAEAYAKWHSYPPPYQGGYATPWLWVDGVSRGYDPSTWEAAITNAWRVPSDVGITHIGTTYDTVSRTGQVQVECYNSGASSIDAAVQFVITEDSINYNGPNGDPWHNHVCRDYVPDQNGTPVTLSAGAADTVALSFSLDASWVQERVKLVLYLQNMTVQPDSSMPCYQGIASNLMELTGVEEPGLLSTGDIRVQVGPNPCRTGCEFTLSGAAAHGARIAVYSPDGRLVSNVQTAGNRASWSRNGVSRGVYLYRVTSGTATTEGKLVVAD
jgi:hypothetical protein